MIKHIAIVTAGFITASAAVAEPQTIQSSTPTTSGTPAIAAPAPTATQAVAGAPATKLSLNTAATPGKAKIICRSNTLTGSLIQQSKRCGTAEDWARAVDNARGAAQQLVTSHAAGMTTF